MKKERWVKIPGYSNYMVSDLGRVKSFPRKVTMFHGFSYYTKERFIRPDVLKNGYQRVVICKNGNRMAFLLHRLVLLSFIGKPKSKDQCLHLNHNKLDNRLKNLKWGSMSENMRMDFDEGRRVSPNKGRFNSDHTASQEVIQYTAAGAFVKSFPSMQEVERATGIRSCAVSLCCNGFQKTTKGFIFKRA